MILHSKRFGDIEIDDDSQLYFPDGLVGFEDLRRFALVDAEDIRPFFWLISMEDPEIGFGVADPELFYAEPYHVSLGDSDRDTLELHPQDAVSFFVIVSLSDGGRRATANLKGPVVLNTRNRLCKQVVIYNPAYSVRQGLLALEEHRMAIPGPSPRDRASARG